LKCKTILVLGTHDNKTINFYLSNGWDFACERFDFKMFGKRIAFTHMPIAWDGYFDINLHGHFHNTDYRRNEPDFNKVISGYNKLISLEFTNYQPLNLRKIIK